MSSCYVVIPARWASTRFPGKPLAEISGKSMIERVHRIASVALEGATVVVASDDQRIIDHVEAFGGRAVMTPASCANGTERVRAALEALEASAPAASHDEQFVINLQGDAVLTPPWVLSAVFSELQSRPDADIVTPAVRLDWQGLDALQEGRSRGEVGGTTVVFDDEKRALYFSKQPIPLVRDRRGDCPVYRHIGLYGYRRAALDRYLSLEAGRLERCEGLEQLRALERGMKVQIVVVEYRGRTHASVDNPQDIAQVEAILEREGELIDG